MDTRLALNTNPDDQSALVEAAVELCNQGAFGMAYVVLARSIGIGGEKNLPPTAREMTVLAAAEMAIAGYSGDETWMGTAGTDLRMAREAFPADPYVFQCSAEWALQMGMIADARACAETALALAPNMPDVQHSLAFVNFYERNWVEGWKHYEKTVGMHQRWVQPTPDAPYWDGRDVDSLIVMPEQGVGEEILFSRFLKDINVVDAEIPAVIDGTISVNLNPRPKCPKRITLYCDPRLQALFARSFPHVTVEGKRLSKLQYERMHGGVKGVNVSATSAPAIMYGAKCLAGSLGTFYGNDLTPSPGYLVADPGKVKVVREQRLAPLPGKKIGVAWTGGKPPSLWHRRGLGHGDLVHLLDGVDGVTWCSLQYELDPEKLNLLQEEGIVLEHFVETQKSKVQDLDWLAALLCGLDGIVTATTAVAHLAGALGIPAIVLVPRHPRWAYGLEGQNPFYGSLIQIRETVDGWPIGEVHAKMRELGWCK